MKTASSVNWLSDFLQAGHIMAHNYDKLQVLVKRESTSKHVGTYFLQPDNRGTLSQKKNVWT